jgi:ADP-ribosyl-[dinitrogen reductase] hydrolase
MDKRAIGRDILLGLAIGDALGVPVEFMDRESIRRNPVKDMRAYGTHHQPAGTFSDDSSLAFCLAAALTEPFTLQAMANKFVAWLNNGYWSAHGTVFDVGNATNQAIRRIERGIRPDLSGGFDISDNGNGSLMRILPLVLLIKDKPLAERYRIAKEVSSVTHGHIRSVIACFYYLEFARLLLQKVEKFDAYKQLQTTITDFLNSESINPTEIDLYHRLLEGSIYELEEEEIFSSGYVLHTLEASIWCILTTDNYAAATLKAVNLGLDTDTTGAVTGGLAGLLYGYQSIPSEWLQVLAKRADIEQLGDLMQQQLEA